MKTKIALSIIVGFITLSFIGCAGNRDGRVLARIDKKDTITVKDLNDRISKLPQRYQDAINKNKKAFLDEVIIDVLLYNEALNQNLDKDSEVKSVIEEAKKKILIARLLKDNIEDKIVVSDNEITSYYDANREQFTMPETLRASHILVKTEGEADEILSKLSAGEDFEELAKAHSVDPTSKVGGDIGYFTRNQLVPEIEDTCYEMQVGDTSGIVKTKFGYHIIKLTERREPRIKELDEVRSGIEQALVRIKKRTSFNQYVAGLKEKSQISVNNDLLETISQENTVNARPEE